MKALSSAISAPPHHSVRIPLIVACAFFMENLDSTVIATALPKMAASFSENPISLNMGVTVYVLTLAVFIPLSAWIADRFGARNVFGSAILVFTGSSILCGASHSLASFLIARVFQGIGGAMMVPVGRIIVLKTTPKADMLRAMAFLTWPALVGPIVGPSVGGFIATYSSWRWIFYMNVPIGILGVALVWRHIENQRSSTRRPFDKPGFVLSAVALVSLMAGLGFLAHGDAPPLVTGGTLVLAVAATAVSLKHMRTAPHPLVDLRPFEVRTFSETCFGGVFSRFAVSASLFVLPLMFQIGFGMSPFISGLFMLVGAVGSLSTKAIAANLVRRLGFKAVLLVNSSLIGLATLACAAFARTTPLAVIALVMVFCGFTRSLQFTCLNTLGFADMPSERIGAASMLTSMFQQIVMGMSVAFAAVMLKACTALRGDAASPLQASDFRSVLILLGLVAFLAVLRFSKLDDDAGLAISGHRR